VAIEIQIIKERAPAQVVGSLQPQDGIERLEPLAAHARENAWYAARPGRPVSLACVGKHADGIYQQRKARAIGRDWRRNHSPGRRRKQGTNASTWDNIVEHCRLNIRILLHNDGVGDALGIAAGEGYTVVLDGLGHLERAEREECQEAQ